MRTLIALGLMALATSATAKIITITAGDDFEASCLHVVEPGDVCYLEEGDYYHDGLTVTHGTENKRITITGDPEACIKGSNTQDRVLQIAHDYYTVEGICFDGQHDDEYTATAIYVLGADYKGTKNGVTSSVTGFQMFNLEIKNFASECVHFRYFVTHAEVSGCTIQHCGIDAFNKGEGGKVGEAIYVGTALSQVDDNKAPEVKIRTGSADNVDADVCAYNWIHHNTFRTHGNECVDIKEGSANNLVEHNVCEYQLDANSGCFGARGSDNTFRWNEISECKGAGIRVGGNNNYGTGNNMYGNIVKNADMGAFKIMAPSQGVVCENMMSGIDLIVSGSGDDQEQFTETAATGACSSYPGDEGIATSSATTSSSDATTSSSDDGEDGDDDGSEGEDQGDDNTDDGDDDEEEESEASTKTAVLFSSGSLQAGINFASGVDDADSTELLTTNESNGSDALGGCDAVMGVKEATVHLSKFIDTTTKVSNLFDKDTDTYFSVHRESTYITFELEEETDVTGIAIGFFMKAAEEARIQVFSVSLRKAEDTDYRTVISRKESSGAMGDVQTFPFSSRQALYVRLETHGNSFNNWTAFTEVEVCVKADVEGNSRFGGLGIVEAKQNILDGGICDEPELLSPEIAKASGILDTRVLFDSDFDTRWSTTDTQNESDLDNGMVQLTYLGDMRVSTIKMAFFDGHLAHQYFSIYSQSTREFVWTPIMLEEQAAMTEGMQTFEINMDDVYKLYIVGKGNDLGDYSKVAEIQVYGC